MRATKLGTACALALALIGGGLSSAEAQTIGTFRWQLQPYCNIVTVAVTQTGGVYELEGTDDQCGAAQTASAIGTAFLNPDGSIGFGLTVVTAPSGSPVHVDAAISLSTLSGTWRDSTGVTGNFVFTPGGGVGGSPRPAAATGVAPGSIGSAQINTSQVQQRLTGVCSTGQFIQSVGQDGAVTCDAEVGDISSVIPGFGLVGGGSSGEVTLSLPLTPSDAFLFYNFHGFVATGAPGAGSIPLEGPGTRAMWYPRKSAFRAGRVDATAWDDANIGSESAAFNKNTRATGTFSAAFGDSTLASAQSSTAMGAFTTASGTRALAGGSNTLASGPASVAFGEGTTASGLRAVAMGEANTASGTDSVALGLASSAGGTASFAMGDAVSASGHTSVALGYHAAATAGGFAFADRSTTTPFTAFNNQFGARAVGGFGFYTNAGLTAGVELGPGASAWSSVSDANMKENFRDLADRDVLEKIARMPVREWNYKAQDAAIRHMGPTAQDFHAAFGLGENPLRISTIDADGIALRAIQALLAEVTALRQRIEQLESRER